MRRSAISLLWAVSLLLAVPAPALEVVNADGRPIQGAEVELVAPLAPEGTLWRLVRPNWQWVTGPEGEIGDPLPRLRSGLLLIDSPSHRPAAIELIAGSPVETVRLQAGVRWEGRIEPGLAGAEICALWTEPHPAWSVERRRRRCSDTVDSGRFAVHGLPPGQVLKLRVELDGMLPWDGDRAPGEDWPEPRLEPGHLLEGVVVSGRRTVSGAVVAARNGAATTTDAEGTFRLAVEALPCELTVRADGFRDLEAEVEAEPSGLRLELSPRERLLGGLLGEQSEEIREASFVVTEYHGEGNRSHRTRNIALEPDGSFALDLDGPGRYSLAVRADGFREQRLGDLRLAPGEHRDLGLLVLAVGGRIHGQLVGADAAPVEGADIRLLPLGSAGLRTMTGRGLPSQVSDIEGRFDLRGLSSGRYELRISHSEHSARSESITLGRDEWVDLGTVPLGPGVTVNGVVHDRAGRARGGLQLRVGDPAGASLFPLVTTGSDSEGRFELGRLRPGTHRIEVEGDRLLLAQEFEVPAGEDEHQLDLEVGGVQLRGVVMRGGEPVAGGSLRLTSALDPSPRRGKVTLRGPRGERFDYGVSRSAIRTQVGADGAFEVEDAPAGLLVARFLGLDGASQVRQLTVPDRPRAEVTLTLDGLALRGEVLDAASGLGLEASLLVTDTAGRQVAFTATDATGAFVVENLAAGGYVVEARAPDHAPAAERVELREGGASPLRLEMAHGGLHRLDLRLVYEDGSAAAFTELVLLDHTGRMVRALLTNAEGRRSFPELSEGDYYLAWSDGRAGAGATGPLRLPQREPGERAVTLGNGAPVTLICAPERCAGHAVFHLSMIAESGIDVGPYLSGVVPGAHVSRAGSLPLGRLSPGVYHLRAWMRDGRHERRVWVPATGDAVVVSLD